MCLLPRPTDIEMIRVNANDKTDASTSPCIWTSSSGSGVNMHGHKEGKGEETIVAQRACRERVEELGMSIELQILYKR